MSLTGNAINSTLFPLFVFVSGFGFCFTTQFSRFWQFEKRMLTSVIDEGISSFLYLPVSICYVSEKVRRLMGSTCLEPSGGYMICRNPAIKHGQKLLIDKGLGKEILNPDR